VRLCLMGFGVGECCDLGDGGEMHFQGFWYASTEVYSIGMLQYFMKEELNHADWRTTGS
jgi:hypothetical protein